MRQIAETVKGGHMNSRILFMGKLDNMIKQEKAYMKRLTACTKTLPAGQLSIQRRGTSFYCYRVKGDIITGITRDKTLCGKLAYKLCCSYQYDCWQTCCKVVKLLMSRVEKEEAKQRQNRKGFMVNRIMNFMSSNCDLFQTDILAYQWASQPYPSNSYYPEQLKYRTTKGRMVRSKSERTIANMLEKYEIPYRYEPEMVFDGKTIYPDFVLMRADGTLIIWEHFGLMDQNDYQMSALQKQERYRRAGYHQHTNLICTYEEDLVSESMLEEILIRFSM